MQISYGIVEGFSPKIAQKITEKCMALRAFQSLEYDPCAGVGTITTEWLIPSNEFERVSEIIFACKADEKVSVRRYEEKYKIVLIQPFII